MFRGWHFSLSRRHISIRSAAIRGEDLASTDIIVDVICPCPSLKGVYMHVSVNTVKVRAVKKRSK